MAPLNITLFGPIQVLVHGQPLPHLRSRKALWLLALLTLRHNRPVEREWLAGTLWPEMDQSQSFSNLRPVCSDLRRALGDQGERLQSPNRHTLSLELTGADIDLLQFDQAVIHKDPATWKEAVALYRGPLLEGSIAEWIEPERTQREQNCLQMLQKLADVALTARDYETASGYWRQAVRIAPYWDAARRGLMEALAENGDSNTALQVYREFVSLLRNIPKAVPDEKTTALYQGLRNEARQHSSLPVTPSREASARKLSPKSPTPARGYLPSPSTELIGREEERREVLARLRRFRLVTLTGFGGIGKTRLAIEIASETTSEYPDGVWTILLESLSDGKHILGQIASVLGLREEPGKPLLQILTEYLREKRLLLLLDNCEHLLEATASVVGHLLRECAGIRVLTTSREPLGITGEITWAVPALPVPDMKQLPLEDDSLPALLMGYESIQFFVERAQVVGGAFCVTPENARTIAGICTQLEGIPLALEFAAARVKTMSVEQVATLLEDHHRLSLLAGDHPSPTPRRQTLRATLDWSYALLGDPERALLHHLSTFAGGWTLEAAESICAGEQITRYEILDLLASLVDKSLVVFAEQTAEESVGRYRLLEIVRQYAAEKLADNRERDLLLARHRNWFTSLIEEAEPQLSGEAQSIWLERLETEHDNLRATLAWSGAEAHGAASDLRLVGTLYRFWHIRGYLSEGREHLSRVLAQEDRSPRTAERALALQGAGTLAYSQGDYAAAQILSEESLSIRRERGDQPGIAWSLNTLGNIAYDRGDYAHSQSLHEESLSIRRILNDKQGIAWSLNSLGNIAHPQGKYPLARALYEESLSLFQQLGNYQGIARSYSCLGYVAFDQGDSATAQSYYEESLRLFQELGDKGGIAWAFACLGYAAFDQEDMDSARTLLEESRTRFQEMGDQRGAAWCLNSLGNVAHREGNHRVAQGFHKESLDIRRTLGDNQGIAWSLLCLGNVICDQGKPDTAHPLLVESLQLFSTLRDCKGVAETLGSVATVLQAQNMPAPAVRLWAAAHALRESIGATQSFYDREKYQRQIHLARVALDQETFALAWDEGHAMSWETAVAYTNIKPS